MRVRPRFGLLRAREFVMKDMYTFDTDRESAMETYAAVDASYAKLFGGMFGESNIARVAADTGNIGGDLSPTSIMF